MCQSTEMYPEVLAKDGIRKHSSQCQMSFGRKDRKCHRCVEIINGAPSRSGWQKQYYTNKKRDEEMTISDIKSHDCAKSGCGPVCTYGEW
jgi:hypothetical protein